MYVCVYVLRFNLLLIMFVVPISPCIGNRVSYVLYVLLFLQQPRFQNHQQQTMARGEAISCWIKFHLWCSCLFGTFEFIIEGWGVYQTAWDLFQHRLCQPCPLLHLNPKVRKVWASPVEEKTYRSAVAWDGAGVGCGFATATRATTRFTPPSSSKQNSGRYSIKSGHGAVATLLSKKMLNIDFFSIRFTSPYFRPGSWCSRAAP